MAFDGALQSFLGHFEKLEASNGGDGPDSGYYKEFMELKGLSQQYKDSDSFPADSGKQLCNKKKNRFKDILPFEHSRVALHPEEDVEGSDYINANYITNASGEVTYIASQGPLPHTVHDFWRMIWYHNIEVVVMACREYEMGKHKCERYWPEKGEVKMFGPISVTTVSEKNISNDFVVRQMKAECQGETQRMRQYHYNAWPDHLKPTAVYPIIRMIEVVHEEQRRPEVPLVVHCSAGCGRTGTIIAIDIIRNLIINKELNEEFSVFNVVKTMRTQRPAMVQAKDQYHFVYQAASMVASNFLEGKKTVPKPPVSPKPSAGRLVVPGGGSGPEDTPTKSSLPSLSLPGGSSPSIYQNPSAGVEEHGVPKPMPRKKSTRHPDKIGADSQAPPPPPPHKPSRTPESSPKPARPGPPPTPPSKPSPPTPAWKLPVAVETTPKKPLPHPAVTPSPSKDKNLSIMDMLMQECGDLLEEKTEGAPTIVEEVDAPSIPSQTSESLRLLDSTYEVPGSSYDVVEPRAFPPQTPPKRPISPVPAEMAPELPPPRSPPSLNQPPVVKATTTPTQPPPSSNGSSSNPSKLFSKLLPKKDKKKPITAADIGGPSSVNYAGGSSGGLMANTRPVAPPSPRSLSPEPPALTSPDREYAVPIMHRSAGGGGAERPTPTKSSSLHSKYTFPGEFGFGIRMEPPRGPRPEPLLWNGRQRRVDL